MRYVSFIHRDDAGYGVSFPDFPGCVSVGDTVDDAVRHGSEALAFHVEGLVDDGTPIPPPRRWNRWRNGWTWLAGGAPTRAWPPRRFHTGSPLGVPAARVARRPTASARDPSGRRLQSPA